MRLPGEPSVDDILDSIKKVIARDDRAGTDARHHIGRDGSAIPLGPDDDDVLDLAAYAPAQADGHGGTAALVTPENRTAMRESLAALATMTQPAGSARPARPGDTSLEELTRELLRPALAEWLDRNLPALVESLVAREIARIVGKTS